MNAYQIAVVAAFAFMTLLTFALFACDKSKAKRGARRISEATLLTCSLLLGGVGGLAGMLVCRHKTKHWYFCLFVPLFAVISVAVTAAVFVLK